MNYTVRATLRKNKKTTTGHCPVAIILTINRRVSVFTTPYKVLDDQWDKNIPGVTPDYPNAKFINADIRKRVSDVERDVLKKSFDGPVELAEVKSAIKGDVQDHNFFVYAQQILNYRKGKDKEATITGYTREINRLKLYAKKLNLYTNDDRPYINMKTMTLSWLRNYEIHERERLSQNSLNSEFKWLCRTLRAAAREKLIKEDPTIYFQIPEYVQSERIFLEKKEREQWTKYWREKKVKGVLYQSLTYFLLGLYSGLRYSDWHQAHTRIYGDNLRLRPIKTDKKDKWIVLPIGPTLKEILKVVATLPPPKSGDKIRLDLKVIAGRLDCTKNITTHSARHGFGCLCAENKVPKSVAAELMGITVKTVEVYYHLSGESISEQAAVLRGI